MLINLCYDPHSLWNKFVVSVKGSNKMELGPPMLLYKPHSRGGFTCLPMSYNWPRPKYPNSHLKAKLFMPSVFNADYILAIMLITTPAVKSNIGNQNASYVLYKNKRYMEYSYEDFCQFGIKLDPFYPYMLKHLIGSERTLWVIKWARKRSISDRETENHLCLFIWSHVTTVSNKLFINTKCH